MATGGGDALVGGSRVVVAAHGEVLLARWLGLGAGATSVRVGPLPHLLEVAKAEASRTPSSLLRACPRPRRASVRTSSSAQVISIFSMLSMDICRRSVGPITTIPGSRQPGGLDDRLSPATRIQAS